MHYHHFVCLYKGSDIRGELEGEWREWESERIVPALLSSLSMNILHLVDVGKFLNHVKSYVFISFVLWFFIILVFDITIIGVKMLRECRSTKLHSSHDKWHRKRPPMKHLKVSHHQLWLARAADSNHVKGAWFAAIISYCRSKAFGMGKEGRERKKRRGMEEEKGERRGGWNLKLSPSNTLSLGHMTRTSQVPSDFNDCCNISEIG